MAVVGGSRQSIETIKNTMSLINSKLNQKPTMDIMKSDELFSQFEKVFTNSKNSLKQITVLLNLYSNLITENLTDENFLDDIFLSISEKLLNYNSELEKTLIQNISPTNFSISCNNCFSLLNLLDSDILQLLFRTNIRMLDGTADFFKVKRYLTESPDIFVEKIKKIENDLSKKERDTTEYLNRQGLCKSFYDRSTILKKESDKWWDRLLLVIIALTFFWGWYLCNDYNSITPENIDFIIKKHFLFLPLSIIVFWFLWITTKKHLYYSRLADDYNYKNDISMAYYGYKNEILPEGKENDALRLKLLDNVLAIITKNPVESSMKSDTSPYTEIIGKLLDQVKKQK